MAQKRMFSLFVVLVMLLSFLPAAQAEGVVNVSSVKLSKTTATLNYEKTLTLKATVKPAKATDKTLTWASAKDDIATVSQDGVVTPMKPGKVKITATASNGKKGVCTVTVKAPVKSVAFEKTELTLEIGKPETLNYTILPAVTPNKAVTFTSSKKNIAAVNSKGVVTPKKAGKTVITVKTKNGGKTAKCTVTVVTSIAQVPLTSISLNKTSLGLTAGASETLSVSYNPTNTTDAKTVTWSSSDAKIVTVSGGTVQAVGTGMATITAKVGNFTATCAVRVYPTEQKAFEIINALRSKYPEGMPWTNDDIYKWKGGIYSSGGGCAGFAFICSDAVFNNLPARQTAVDVGKLKVGDILRYNTGSGEHSVVILTINETGVTLTEGNYNSSIHWDRVMSFEEIKAGGMYVMTRYA